MQSGFSGLPGRQAGNFLFSQGRRQSISFPSFPGRHSPSSCWGKPSQAGNNLPSSQAGSLVTRSGRQNPRHSARQRALQASQGNSTASQADSTGIWDGNLHLTPLIGSLKGLPMKTPTLSGSLTYPTNLWHQHKGLFCLKDPTLW